MDILGYLITLVNMQHLNSGGPLKNVSVKVAEIQTLYSELQAAPEWDLSMFKDTGYYRYKNVGKYLSRNLREFMFNGSGKPNDEGVVLTLSFAEVGESGLVKDDDKLSLFLHKNSIEEEVMEQVENFLDTRYGRHERGYEVLPIELEH